MMILLLSGPAAAGKSTICKHLAEDHGFAPIKSSLYLRSLVKPRGTEITRELLQEISDRLDLETDFKWLVVDVAVPQMAKRRRQEFWFVDNVRKFEQVDMFSKAFPGQILHCHITAPEDVLKSRLLNRSVVDGNIPYEETIEERITHPNEVSARSLEATASLVVDTSQNSASSACSVIMRRVRALCGEGQS